MLAKLKSLFSTKPEKISTETSLSRKRRFDGEPCEQESKRGKYDTDLPVNSGSGKFTNWIYRQFFGNSTGPNQNQSDRGMMSDQQKHKPIQMPSNSNLHQQNVPKQMFQMKPNISFSKTNEMYQFSAPPTSTPAKPYVSVYSKIASKVSPPKIHSKYGLSMALNSIRLKEKKEYAKLLQSHCSRSIHLNSYKPNPFMSPYPSERTLDTFDTTFRPAHAFTSTPAVAAVGHRPNESVIDLTFESKKSVYYDKIDKSAPRKFENNLKKSKYANNPDWLLQFQRKYSEEKRRADKEFELCKLQSDYYSKEREKLHLEAEQRLLNKLTLAEKEPVVLEDIFDEKEELEFKDLTPEQDGIVEEALQISAATAEEELVKKFNIPIRRMDIETLKNLNWLNDEVINYYLSLVTERSNTEEDLPKVYNFNTFFYTSLATKGYSAVRRWTRRVDLFSKDIILIPVHLGMHWCMCIIDFQNKAVKYFDSMGGRNQNCLDNMKEYLCCEMQDKKKQTMDLTGWQFLNVEDVPQQMNGSDCGMFSCKFAEYYSRRADFTFTQEHMPYFRRRMIYELLSEKLM